MSRDNTGIVVIVGADLRVSPNADAHAGAPLPRIVQWFKTMKTNEYICMVKQLGWSAFPGKLWQRNYFEHVIRNEKALNRIREYIATNPLRWELDRENPLSKGEDNFDHWITSFKTSPGEGPERRDRKANLEVRASFIREERGRKRWILS